MEAQLQIRQNAMEMQEYMQDIFQWQKSISAKEKKPDTHAKSQSVPAPRGRAANSSISSAPSELQAPAVRPQAVTKKSSSSSTTTKAANGSAASHTYTAYSKWDRFDVDAALQADEEGEAPVESHSAPPQHQEPLAKAADPNAILTKDPRNGSLPAVDMTARSTIRSSSATAPKGEDARPLPPIRSQEPQTPDAWKARGNDLFKIGQWESAAECYSKGFNLFDLTSPSTSTATLSSAAVVLSNRAMSYLKMKMWTEAEADCTRALELDPGNAKAFHRRGLARKGLSRLEEAMGDFESASRLEPPSQYHVFSHSKQSGPNAAPSSSLSERDSCLSELIEREGLKEEPLKGRAGSKTGANKGKEGIEVVLITTPPSAAEASKGDNTGSAGLDKVIEVGEKKEVEANVHQAEKRAPAAASQTSASAAAAAAAVAAASRSVMMRPPVTSTDFESSWRSFSDDLSLQCSYLNLLVPDQLASVFKSTLTPQTLASILKSLLSGVTFGSIKVNHAVGVIQGLVLIPRFEMTAMSLAGKERTVIKDLWEKVMVTEGGGGLADEALRKKFRV